VTADVVEIQKAWSKHEALTDLRKLKEVGTQKFLAERYGVSEATVSKWLKDWQTNGEVARPRDGRKKQVLALPAPRRKA
jgi:transposase-like protein